MTLSKPTPRNVIRDDFTTGTISGGRGNDHLIHHRDDSIDDHAGTGLFGFAGDDILEASVPNRGQIHMFGATGNDWLILDVTKIENAGGTQGHHVYGGTGQNTFQFKNIEQNLSPIIGRIDDFDPTSDRILIEDMQIDLTDLPKHVKLPGGQYIEVRVIEIEHPEFIAENLGAQYFLAIGDNIFYALEGARDLQNGTTGLMGDERHFLHPDALETLRTAETVQYVNPKNFVPREFYEHREDDLALNYNQRGDEIFAETGDRDAVYMFGTKSNAHGHHGSTGAQIMRGSDGDDVIQGNTGNDTIFGGHGNDLIAGGIDNDVIHGGPGNDMIWGGDGNDSLYGGRGDDYLHGGRGDDLLVGGEGNDTLVGGRGNNTLVGGGGDAAVNRFHFAEDEGYHIITDFKVGADLITLQHNIDPLTVKLSENVNGNTVLNYGFNASVELQGVSLKAFQEAAQSRTEGGDPIIRMTGDPEEELLHKLRVEIGYYGDDAPPPAQPADRPVLLEPPAPTVPTPPPAPLPEEVTGKFLIGRPKREDMWGGPGDDFIYGGNSHDIIRGFAGNNTLHGGYGHDTIFGGAGDDLIVGGAGNDRLWGMDGNDTIFGVSGNNRFGGGAGDDLLIGGTGNDTIYGGTGNDTIYGNAGNNSLWGMRGDDLIHGSDGDDRIGGGRGNDTIFGHGGNDTIYGGLGDDLIYGGAGDDELWGMDDNDTIFGGTGNDFIHGGRGDDVLDGGPGDDTMVGGPGADTFIFDEGHERLLIRDFTFDQDDRLQLDHNLWGGGLSAAQVVNAYGQVTGGQLILDFGSGDIITLAGITDMARMADYIDIV